MRQLDIGGFKLNLKSDKSHPFGGDMLPTGRNGGSIEKFRSEFNAK
jgi:hypothetical protein